MSEDAETEPSGAEHPETRIDAAWRAAQDAPDSDAAAARFLDVVLAEALLCPVWESAEDGADSEGEGDEVEEISDGREVAPKMLEIEGRDTLLLFDSEERLAMFSTEPTAFIALPGRAYFQMLAGQGAQIALNLEVAPSSTLFGSETVEALAELVEAGSEETELDPNTPLIVSAPTDAPSALVAALAARLNAARNVVAEAWLATISEEDPAEPGAPGANRRLVLCVRPAEAIEESAGRELAMELGQLGTSFLEDRPLEVALVAAEDPVLGAARAEGFGLIRSAS